jgi:hypothetical protein
LDGSWLGANLFFHLISRRYERGPMILTSNQSFGASGDVFGDRVIATAILDRLLHHAVTWRSQTVAGNPIARPRYDDRAPALGFKSRAQHHCSLPLWRPQRGRGQETHGP